jgi:hypothetical protein
MQYDEERDRREPKGWNDDDRLSWRERDKQKDRSGHRSEEREYDSSRTFKKDYQKERYKKHLEEFFSASKKPSEAERKELKKLSDAKSPDKLKKACDKYIKEFGIPKNWDSLLLFVDYPEGDLLETILLAMEKLLPEQPPTRQENFRQQLRLLKMTTSNPSVRKVVEAFLTRLPGD